MSSRLVLLTSIVPSLLAPTALAVQGSCPQNGAMLCVPLDSTFSVVPFNTATCARNDDGFVGLPLNGWSFDFYGSLETSLFVNNNGNVSFGQGFSAFSSSGFPVNGFPMIAPFWADVDTRASESGAVWFREWSIAGGDAVNRFVVTWDHVGYFSTQFDKLNTFQLILTDGNDPLIGIGNNVAFCYDDMQWTTGSASGGNGGFGGTPATVGANSGNGIDFFQIGRFDHEGVDYDGPGGNADGVSFLDNSVFRFSTSSASTNTAPIFLNPPSALSVNLGQPLDVVLEAIGPEIGETVTMSVIVSPALNFSFMTTPGNPASLSFRYTPMTLSEVGPQLVQIRATDDGSPPMQATIDLTIDVRSGGVGDTVAPLCTVTRAEPSRVDGEARDDRPLDSGIATVALSALSQNLSLHVDGFAAGDAVVNWSLGRLDSSAPGTGDVVVTDVAGNQTSLPVSVAPSGDCNGNGVPDSMDLASQTSYDRNANGIPDECEQVGFVYCPAQPHNSTGRPATLIASGSNRAQDNALLLSAFDAPPFSFGFFATSASSAFVSGPATGISYGNLCLGNPLGGFRNGLTPIDAQGRFSRIADLSALPTASGPMPIVPGTTVFFQGWYRDSVTIIPNNFTNAVQVLFH